MIAIASVHGDVSHLNGVRDYKSLLNTINHPSLQNLDDVDIEQQNIVYVPTRQQLPSQYQRVLESFPGNGISQNAASGFANNGRFSANFWCLFVESVNSQLAQTQFVCVFLLLLSYWPLWCI